MGKTLLQPKKRPQRTCLGCRAEKDKNLLLRIVRTPEGEDETGKKNGRGAYICRDETCFLKVLRSGALRKSLDTDIPGDLREKIAEVISRGEG
ncbi:MAG: RNase P modulator RnpM [bacterium]